MQFALLVGEFVVHCLTINHRILELGRALTLFGPSLSFHSEDLEPTPVAVAGLGEGPKPCRTLSCFSLSPLNSENRCSGCDPQLVGSTGKATKGGEEF